MPPIGVLDELHALVGGIPGGVHALELAGQIVVAERAQSGTSRPRVQANGELT